MLIMGIVQRLFIPSFPIIIWHLAPILHHFMKMILQQRQRFCKIEITKVWVGGLVNCNQTVLRCNKYYQALYIEQLDKGEEGS